MAQKTVYSVYVLRSGYDGSYYVGNTGKDVQERLIRHNSGDCRYTKGRRPWEIVFCKKYGTRAEAVKRERFLKTGVGRQELKQRVAVKVT